MLAAEDRSGYEIEERNDTWNCDVEAVMAAFANDRTSVRKCETLRTWWGILINIGLSFGYLPQSKKIMAYYQTATLRQSFGNFPKQVSTREERYFGVVIGIRNLKQGTGLPTRARRFYSDDSIGKTLKQPQSAYGA